MHTLRAERRASARILWSFVTPHRRVLALGIALGLLTTAAALATPMVTKNVLDTLGTPASLAQPVGVLAALLVLGSVAGLAQYVVLGRLAEQIVLDARLSLITQFFRSRLDQIQQFRAGELVTRVTSDTILLREATTASVVQIVNGVVSLVGTVVLMAVLDIPLLVATAITLVVVAVPLVVLMPKIGEADRLAQEAVGDLGGSLEGGMRALRTVKASGAEGREIAASEEKARTSARHAIRSVWISSATWTIAGGGIQLAIIAILGFGAWRVSSGEMAVSTLVAFLLYAFNIVEPITSLTMAATQLQSGLAASARIRETQHLALEDVTATPGRSGPAGRGMAQAPRLALQHVSARYAGTASHSLRDVSLEIPRTGHLALVGPSGAGKTTIFSLLLRFLEPESGSIHLDGVPFDQLSIEEVRSRIAYVEQETPVIPGTIRDNVSYRYPGADDDQVWRALNAVGLVEKVRGLPDGLDAPVASTNLSGGERQRLAVARALIGSPDLLLLDEATAQLDGVSEAAIHTAIAEVAQHGTVVTIAHRLSTVIDADRIVVLERGTVRAEGTHEELLRTDALYSDFVTALRIAT